MRVVSSTMIAAVRVTRMPALCANRTAGCPGHAHSGRTSECAVRPRGSLDRSSSYARVERSHTRRGFVVTLAMGAGGSGVLDRTLTPVKDRQRKRPPIYKVRGLSCSCWCLISSMTHPRVFTFSCTHALASSRDLPSRCCCTMTTIISGSTLYKSYSNTSRDTLSRTRSTLCAKHTRTVWRW